MKERTIEQIKELYGINGKETTSEELFDIETPPDYQCDFISGVIKEASLVEDAMKYAIDYCRDDDAKNAEFEIDYRMSEIRNVQNDIEEIRSRITEVREWGQKWKELCKNLISEVDDDKIKKYINYREDY